MRLGYGESRAACFLLQDHYSGTLFSVCLLSHTSFLSRHMGYCDLSCCHVDESPLETWVHRWVILAWTFTPFLLVFCHGKWGTWHPWKLGPSPSIVRRQNRNDKRSQIIKNNVGCHSAHFFEVPEPLHFSKANLMICPILGSKNI